MLFYGRFNVVVDSVKERAKETAISLRDYFKVSYNLGQQISCGAIAIWNLSYQSWWLILSCRLRLMMNLLLLLRMMHCRL